MNLKDAALMRTHAYIDGEWAQADDGARFPVTNPANGARIAEVPDMGEAETLRAIAAAERAQVAWRATTAKHRADCLRRWYDLIRLHQADLAALMTAEQGKPLAEAEGEVVYGASFVEWFAEEATRTYGELIPAPAGDRRLIVIKQPVGVVAALTPWNFPVAMATRKVAPALAAGCTVVLKPASETPLCALALAELARRAGVPPGVFNVVTSARAAVVGAVLARSPVVRKLSFTGSTRVGRLLMEQSAANIKKLSLELGGNAPFIVFEDADLDAAVRGAMVSKYRNAGQTCVCANRMFVHAAVYDEFARRLGEAVAALKVGDGSEPGITVGPLINARAAGRVHAMVEDAAARGARILAGGKRPDAGSAFYAPTIVGDVTPAMELGREEIFGPVAPLLRFESDEQVVRMANDTPFGLAGYFYTRDLSRVWRVAEALECGMVGINEGLISTAVAPFGGVKESGLGREGARQGIEDYLEPKYMCMGGI
ncbi:NAD-dependent succinate-semialdehyde dehydrogenase [Cupriavidus sp. 2TAF22]|uniref:NAD-dependent succinate-semialdehyde dehydrogenase n=1 Tax=unclassified Cupriavidus TaxID=2640874 RepID=UPI003F91F897